MQTSKPWPTPKTTMEMAAMAEPTPVAAEAVAVITVYDIDLINGVLYTLNHDTEEIFRYDIREILENLQ